MKQVFSPPAINYQILKPYDFLLDIEYESQKAQRRVWVQAMYFEDGHVMKRLRTLFRDAAHRSLDVRLLADYFSLHFSNGSYLKKGSTGYLRIEQMLTSLRKDGVNVTLINQPKGWQRFFAYAGRNHMKLVVIDDIAYIGGLNFGDRDFELLDFMVKCTDPTIIASLVNLFNQTEMDELQNESIMINSYSTIITDKGDPYTSPIMDRGVSAIRDAKSKICFTSQFVPDGPMLRELTNAMKRKVSVELIVPAKNDYNGMFLMVYQLGRWHQWLQNRHLPVVFHRLLFMPNYYLLTTP